jgi:tetratricopeptide (TPR) repeat protein
LCIEQLVGMRLVSILIFQLFIHSIAFADTKDDLKEISRLISVDLSAAREKALSLREENKNSKDYYLQTKSNYLLGYIYGQEGDFGKSILHYLEAIRNAEKSKYEGVDADIISLNNRCGMIFRKFHSHDLAEKYYNEGILKAISKKDTAQLLIIYYNLAGLYMDKNDYQAALNLLSNKISLTQENSEDYLDYLNRMAVVEYEAGNYYYAIQLHEKVLSKLASEDERMLGYSYHNIALNYKKLGQPNEASDFFEQAIEVKSKASSKKNLFSSYFDLGDLLVEENDLKSGILYLKKAEEILPEVTDKKQEFKLYKVIANAYYLISNYSESKRYEDLYTISLNEYLDLQQEIQELDKMYNMDLITKRYFDEVDKQEKIASILFYSRLTSGSLLILLLAVIGYNRYEKLRVRKLIEQQILNLEV